MRKSSKFTPHLQRTEAEKASWAATILFGHIRSVPEDELHCLKTFVDDELKRRGNSK